MSDHISVLHKSSFYHNREIRRIRSCLNLNTAVIIATSSNIRLDYCNYLLIFLPLSLVIFSSFSMLLLIAFTRTSKFSHISSVLKSLHWRIIKGNSSGDDGGRSGIVAGLMVVVVLHAKYLRLMCVNHFSHVLTSLDRFRGLSIVGIRI
jgi:hypothetical protein